VNDEPDAVICVAWRVAEREALTTDLMGKEGVPTALRLVVAAVALTAVDQPVNKKALSTAAPAARSASLPGPREVPRERQEKVRRLRAVEDDA